MEDVLPVGSFSTVSDIAKLTPFSERSALDKVNSKGTDESKPIVSEELGQDTWTILRRASGNVAAAIFGSSLDEEHKKRIGRTLLGSLYFTDLWGNDEGQVDSSTLAQLDTHLICLETVHLAKFKPRLVYIHPLASAARSISTTDTISGPSRAANAFLRYVSQHFSQRTTIYLLSGKDAVSKSVDQCNAEKPRECTAFTLNANKVEKAAPDAITVFDRVGSRGER
jgi:hypothetical protein